jgi:Putative auto-transporter adhesin, head GIN domain
MKRYNFTFKVARYFFLLVVMVIFNTSCDDSSCPVCNDSNDWNPNKIKGSGNIINEERTVPFFNSINHNTVGQVNITYGSTRQVIVRTDDNIQQYVKTKVQDNTLQILIESEFGLSDFSLTIDIVMTELKSLSANSAGNITGTNTFFTNDAYLNLNSAGNIRLNLETIDLHSNISSAGNLFLGGKAQNHYAGLYSAGNLFAYDLETKATRISLNSAGNAFINVIDYLDATLTSAGYLYYVGYPEIVQSTTSIGRVVNSNL